MKSQLLLLRPLFPSLRLPRRTPFLPPHTFASTTAGKNRIYTPVRTKDEFSTLLLVSASSRQALITLWSASFCPSCRIVVPLVQDAIEKAGVGEEEGGVGFAVVEFDAPGLEGLGTEYFINSLPTLLSFSRQEAQLETKVTSVEELKDREFLELWIRNEARRRGSGGAGGGGEGLFGGMFGLGGR